MIDVYVKVAYNELMGYWLLIVRGQIIDYGKHHKKRHDWQSIHMEGDALFSAAKYIREHSTESPAFRLCLNKKDLVKRADKYSRLLLADKIPHWLENYPAWRGFAKIKEKVGFKVEKKENSEFCVISEVQGRIKEAARIEALRVKTVLEQLPPPIDRREMERLQAIERFKTLI